MAVLTLEETKQYLRVDSADEDDFISELVETGVSAFSLWSRKRTAGGCSKPIRKGATGGFRLRSPPECKAAFI